MITGTERWAVLGTTEEEGGQRTCIHKHIHVRARPDDRQLCHYANGCWKALHNVCSLSRPARGFGELEGKPPLDLKAWNNRKNRSKPLPLLSEMLPLDSVGESGEGLSRKKTPESGRCEGKDSLWVIRRFLWKKTLGRAVDCFRRAADVNPPRFFVDVVASTGHGLLRQVHSCVSCDCLKSLSLRISRKQQLFA